MMRTIPDYKLIDIHTHMGPEYCIYYPAHDADSMVRYMDECNIELIVSAPCEDLFVAGSARRDITDAMRRYPDRIRGYFGFNPNAGTMVAEMERAFRENPGYVGLKFLPDYHRTMITDKSYAAAFAFANERGLIVLCHTWGVSMSGEQCNSADKILKLVEQYPNMKFIMGHSIQGQTELAIEIARDHDNAYLDLCDTGRFYGMIEKMVAAVGAEKVLYATDAPMQGYRFIQGAVLGADITEDEQYLIFRGNAARLLGLKA